MNLRGVTDSQIDRMMDIEVSGYYIEGNRMLILFTPVNVPAGEGQLTLDVVKEYADLQSVKYLLVNYHLGPR